MHEPMCHRLNSVVLQEILRQHGADLSLQRGSKHSFNNCAMMLLWVARQGSEWWDAGKAASLRAAAAQPSTQQTPCTSN